MNICIYREYLYNSYRARVTNPYNSWNELIRDSCILPPLPHYQTLVAAQEHTQTKIDHPGKQLSANCTNLTGMPSMELRGFLQSTGLHDNIAGPTNVYGKTLGRPQQGGIAGPSFPDESAAIGASVGGSDFMLSNDDPVPRTILHASQAFDSFLNYIRSLA